VRLGYDRALVEDERLKEHMAAIETTCTRSVLLSRRRKKSGYVQHPRTQPRKERRARLAISATRVTFKRPGKCGADHPKTLAINVVSVREVNAPQDVVPVEWILGTSEPIKRKKDLLRIIDIYRARWTIEEFFKAIKTGCAYEQRQLESWSTLLNALAIFVPIAWNLLRMRALEREDDSAPANRILTDTQLHVLAAKTKALSSKPTIKEVLSAIARLGGHLKQNGPPGWQILGRGYIELVTLEAGYRLAKDEEI